LTASGRCLIYRVTVIGQLDVPPASASAPAGMNERHRRKWIAFSPSQQDQRPTTPSGGRCETDQLHGRYGCCARAYNYEHATRDIASWPQVTWVPANGFVWDLRRSNLIDRGQLDQEVGDFLKKNPRAEPPALAEYLVQRGILSKFQAQRILEGKTQGLVLGPYNLIDSIGTGSMGQVYKAISKSDNKYYAVKVLPRRSMWKRAAGAPASAGVQPVQPSRGGALHRRGHLGRHALPGLDAGRGGAARSSGAAARSVATGAGQQNRPWKSPRG
jgi:hypothetical protein